ncbi:hypothetical protein ACJMK2_006948 [Sinanodonta woodiana]|uniref:C-terminal of Roc (COR) domain-containing protein n=1 Tax=Sinanodonta woodiana TaxID=1069815 RepID=A0ABD3VVG5_SINWO
MIHRTVLEAFNQAEAVPIPTEELDLFLKYQNDIGTILYFSMEVLNDKIVLVPQWLIDAIKSLITAEMFVLKKAPAVTEKWDMFNKSGKLSPELIDAIWTKENKPDLHDNKDHILLLMEHLNIIARPRCFSEDGSEIKMENYFLAPFGYRVDRLIPVADLQGNVDVPCHFHEDSHVITSRDVVEFWFQEEIIQMITSNDPTVQEVTRILLFTAYAGTMPSTPISDKDRFMCIAYLLNDVGSKVLRQLFHDMVTHTCTLGQHLANNKNKIDSLLKKKVLNASQMDIMFPPNGDPTNLTDYDITLLSALFNNIMPSLGHQEKNLIKSLRENRNKLYGHTKSCKMNASDFQTCWSDISSTLITLSQQCVDTKFTNDISVEIQQTQVPDASYLSMIHTLYSKIERIEQKLE